MRKLVLGIVALAAAALIVGFYPGRVEKPSRTGIGPLAVRPDRQQNGVGSALMHAVLGAADALGEPLVALLGDPAYYSRFGFLAAAGYQITAPRPQWQPRFQVRVLSGYQPGLRGIFTYPPPFDRT